MKYFFQIFTIKILLFVLTGTAMAYEEPTFKLIKNTDIYEIRYYGDRLVATTRQISGEDRAFRRLFNYISGANDNSSKISMTVPVLKSDDRSGTVMHFILPKNYSIQNAPLPKDGDVELVSLTGGYYAVIKYSGRPTTKRHKIHAGYLKDALNKHSISIKSGPIQAIYNGPFTPFFFRRNETMYLVNWE
ncbi:MAG: heme-binding protein [Planktomarina sp.]|jgi:DNA gyrase inhibitor GyrI|nr:SOUL heme-binding protein [Planktomarina sp.]MDV3049861.1 heme-binding protein [Planktomarina sp.]|tara:strand:+ start:154 stop:720 length:567 start_codon:yes stop_codon:yes gene_type:complete